MMEWQQWMRRLRISFAYRTKLVAQWIPIFPKEKQLQPFIILGHPRSGSTLLHTLLNSHIRICSQGEWLGGGFEEKVRMGKASVEEHLHQGLSNFRYPVKAVGLKVFYEYGNTVAGAEAIEVLSKWPQLRVIDLRRTHLLRQYISLQIAKKTQQWSIIKNASQLPLTERVVTVDIEDCLRYFNELESLEEAYRPLFQKSPCLKISYEELLGNQEEVLEQLIDFLGVGRWNMVSPLIQQNPESWETLVTNAPAIKEALQHSQWAYLLEK